MSRNQPVTAEAKLEIFVVIVGLKPESSSSLA